MALSCNRCSQTNNGPSAFLLTCGSCKRSWHHRCHIPPVEDSELIQRIRYTNTGDLHNGLAGWKCKRCKKKQAVETSVSTTAQSLTPDDSKRLFSAHTQSIASANDQKREADNANVATASHSAGPASNVDSTILVSHNAKDTELNDHGNQHQQQQNRHTDSHLGNTDTDSLPTTANKRLQVKRALREQRDDPPDASHDLELPDQPAAYTKYARAPDGKKVVSPEHSTHPTHLESVKSRTATSVSERATHSPSARPHRDEERVHYESVMESPGEGSGPKEGTLIDTPSGPPVAHGDVRMNSLDDDSDDLYAPVSQINSSTPGPSTSKQCKETRGGCVTQADHEEVQQGQQSEEIDDDTGGVSPSNHEANDRSNLTKQTSKPAEAPLGPSWLKARYSVVDDPWRSPHDREHGDRRRKKPTARFLGDVAHSTVATLDGELLEFLFFRDWFRQIQTGIAI